MVVDDIPPERAFASPFPYLIFILMWVVVLPVYAFCSNWFGSSLPRLLLAGMLLALGPTTYAYSYFLIPRAHFVAFLLIGGAATGAFVFWACLRLFRER